VTTCSTASKTFSHEVRKASAVSFHESRRAQRARNNNVGSGQGALSIGPRNLLNDDRIATAAIDTPHRIEQKNQKSPERDELEAALAKLVVAGSRLMATRTHCLCALAGTHGDLNALVVGAETGLAINESRKTVTTI
jgi:hypothetical protein